MGHVKIFALFLIVSSIMLLGSCVGDVENLAIDLDIEGTTTIDLAGASIHLTGSEDTWTGSTQATVSCTDLNGFTLYAQMGVSGDPNIGKLKASTELGDYYLTEPLYVALPELASSSLAEGEVHGNYGYTAAPYIGTISFAQSVITGAAGDLGGHYIGTVVVGVTPVFSAT